MTRLRGNSRRTRRGLGVVAVVLYRLHALSSTIFGCVLLFIFLFIYLLVYLDIIQYYSTPPFFFFLFLLGCLLVYTHKKPQQFEIIFSPPPLLAPILFCRERSSRQLFTERRNQQHHFLENHFWDWTRVVLMALNVFLKAVEIIGPWISLDHRILGAWRPETWWEADEQTESAVVTG